MPKITAMKPYVGMAKTVPDSLTPRRFMRASTAMNSTHISTEYGRRLRKAEVIASTPAATDTATVST
jgi:hypothetical protein